ncbi:hypothetical protein ACPEEZ_03415 [Frigoribacterium sp. 2-23]|uniref:hypothetical protein n=1 Tax=Frigoribacterium sp. 2-23 TaxID=3415006 RepID=UPI003C6F1B90
MTDETDDRRAELMAAWLADDLSANEADELEAMRRVDPTIDAELASFGDVTDRLGAVATWHADEPGEELRRRVEAIAADDVGPGTGADAGAASAGSRGLEEARVVASPRRASSRPSRLGRGPGARRPWLLAVGAAACVALGLGAGVLLATPRDTVVAGPPGTLGATEHVDFSGAPSGVDVDGDVVAHTWGTETVLTVDGLAAGDEFSVVVVTDSGQEFSSGTFLGADTIVDCRLNAAVLREEVVKVEVRDAAGTDIAVAELPATRA